MMQTKTIAMVLLIAIAAVGAIAIVIGTAAQSAQAFDERNGPGQSEVHDGTGDLNSGLNSNGHGRP